MTPYLPHEEGNRWTHVQKRYNYKLSSTRMPVECAFGRLKGRFRILKSVMSEKSLDRTTALVLACFVLHNMFFELDDDLFHGEPESVFVNDKTQPADNISALDPSGFLRQVAKNKRDSIARAIY